MKKNPHLYPAEGEKQDAAAQPQVVWELNGPVGEFCGNQAPKKPRKKPVAKVDNLSQPSIVIVKTQIKRRFKTPTGSPALRSVPTDLMGRYGMHQFVDKERLRYANQMWRHRTNPVANSSRGARGNWVSQTSALSPSVVSTDLEAGLMPPSYASVTSTNQSPSVADASPGITTGSTGYTIQYADIPVQMKREEKPESKAQEKRNPVPPLDPRKSRSVEGTKIVRKMYRRKYGKQKHRLAHVDKLDPLTCKSKQGVKSRKPRASGLPSSASISSNNNPAAAYHQYYEFLQKQLSTKS